MRPQRPRNGFSQGSIQEQSLDQQQLSIQLSAIGEQVSTIAADVSEIKNDGNLLKQNLLGGVDTETQHGRIPKLEMDVLDLRARIVVLEGAHIKYKTFGVVIGLISACVSSIITGSFLLLIRYFLFGGKY